MDLYRLEAPEEVFELGVEDSFMEAANLVEWPSKMGSYWPADAIAISITFSDDDSADAETRLFSLSASQAIITALTEKLALSGLELSA